MILLWRALPQYKAKGFSCCRCSRTFNSQLWRSIVYDSWRAKSVRFTRREQRPTHVRAREANQRTRHVLPNTSNLQAAPVPLIPVEPKALDVREANQRRRHVLQNKENLQAAVPLSPMPDGGSENLAPRRLQWRPENLRGALGPQGQNDPRGGGEAPGRALDGLQKGPLQGPRSNPEGKSEEKGAEAGNVRQTETIQRTRHVFQNTEIFKGCASATDSCFV